MTTQESHYDAAPVPEMKIEYLDERRIRQYFVGIKKLPEKYDQDQQEHLCLISDQTRHARTRAVRRDWRKISRHVKRWMRRRA